MKPDIKKISTLNQRKRNTSLSNNARQIRKLLIQLLPKKKKKIRAISDSRTACVLGNLKRKFILTSWWWNPPAMFKPAGAKVFPF